MTARTGAWLDDLTWQEAKARFDEGTVVVVPVGGASTAHGPHLPLKTNAVAARALAQRLVDRLPVVATGVVEFGADAAVGKLRMHGVRRIAIVDTGVEMVAGELGDVEVLQVRDLDRTSVMLALDPRSVRMALLPPEAAQASAFKGERLLEARVEELVAALARRWPHSF